MIECRHQLGHDIQSLVLFQNCDTVVYQWTDKCQRCRGTGLVDVARRKGKHHVISTCIACTGLGEGQEENPVKCCKRRSQGKSRMSVTVRWDDNDSVCREAKSNKSSENNLQQWFAIYVGMSWCYIDTKKKLVCIVGLWLAGFVQRFTTRDDIPIMIDPDTKFRGN